MDIKTRHSAITKGFHKQFCNNFTASCMPMDTVIHDYSQYAGGCNLPVYTKFKPNLKKTNKQVQKQNKQTNTKKQMQKQMINKICQQFMYILYHQMNV